MDEYRYIYFHILCSQPSFSSNMKNKKKPWCDGCRWLNGGQYGNLIQSGCTVLKCWTRRRNQSRNSFFSISWVLPLAWLVRLWVMITMEAITVRVSDRLLHIPQWFTVSGGPGVVNGNKAMKVTWNILAFCCKSAAGDFTVKIPSSLW
jgi:hypothetical protein